jgi:acetylglutamate kinase
VTGPLVVKFGGELLEEPSRLRVVVSALGRIVRAGTALVVVHGGGKEIDAALKVAGIPKRQIEGLRITDAATLDVVVSVLAGAINTRFVAALNHAGVNAVGLTGADARCGLVAPAPPHRTVDGQSIDLERVGIPSGSADPALVALLAAQRYVPVIACIGLGSDGQLYNVNADTFAGYLAAHLGATRLVIAGTTAGVLDGAGNTVAVLEPEGMEALIAGGTATAGMIAKLRSCGQALAQGVGDVIIVDGRDENSLVAAALDTAPPRATRLTPAAADAQAGSGR